MTPRPSVIDEPNFDAEKDAQALRDAMKGAGTDEEEIIAILCSRSYNQLTTIDKTYKQMFGRILIDDLKSELSGSFEKVILRLFLSDAGKDAHTLKQAIKGLGTDETAVIEIMCTSNNEELAAIKSEYQKEYKKDLMKDLIGDTSGDFKRLLVSMSAGDRDENGPDLSHAEAAELAKPGTSGTYQSPRRKQKRGDDGKFKTGYAEEEYEVTPLSEKPILSTPEKEKPNATEEVISPPLFVTSAEEGELHEGGETVTTTEQKPEEKTWMEQEFQKGEM